KRPPRLLAGPYTPPPLRRGERTFCLYRDADVTVTSWTSAPISWPRCCPRWWFFVDGGAGRGADRPLLDPAPDGGVAEAVDGGAPGVDDVLGQLGLRGARARFGS